MLLCETFVCMCVCEAVPFLSSSTPFASWPLSWSYISCASVCSSQNVRVGVLAGRVWSCSIPWDYDGWPRRAFLTPYFLLLTALLFGEGHGGLSWWSSGWESTCQWKGHRFDSQVWKTHMLWSNKAQEPQPLSLCSRAWEATRTEPTTEPHLELVLHKRSHHKEKPAHWTKVTPTSRNESPHAARKIQCSQKIIKEKDMDPFSYFTTYLKYLGSA